MQGVEGRWGGHVLNLVRGDKLASLSCGVTVSEDTRLHKQTATRPYEAEERRYKRPQMKTVSHIVKYLLKNSRKVKSFLNFVY